MECEESSHCTDLYCPLSRRTTPRASVDRRPRRGPGSVRIIYDASVRDGPQPRIITSLEVASVPLRADPARAASRRV